jgi:PmbA protein
MQHLFSETELQYIAEQAIAEGRLRKLDATEVAFSQSIGFAVTVRNKEIETLEHHRNKGFTITVYRNHKTGTASSSDISLDSVRSCLDKACAIADYTEQDLFLGLADPELMAYDYPNLELFHPWNISPAEAIQIGMECEAIALEQDPRIKQSEGASVSTVNHFHLYANSHAFTGYFPSSEHSISCSLVAEAEGQMESDYEYTVARNAKDLMDVAFVAKKSAEKTVGRLGARQIKTQKCPVIFKSNVAKGLLQSFVSAISGGNIYRRTSFLNDALHQRIFPEFIEIYQEPHLLNGMGSSPFDAEGVKTWDCHYVKKGELVSYVLGSYSARKLGLKTTGNAGGVCNLKIASHLISLDEMIKQMGKGLLVTDLMGQGVNILTGNYSRGASGFWVEHGEIQYPVHEITIAGNLKEMFANILAVGNDVDRRGTIHTGSILIESMMVAGE